MDFARLLALNASLGVILSPTMLIGAQSNHKDSPASAAPPAPHSAAAPKSSGHSTGRHSAPHGKAPLAVKTTHADSTVHPAAGNRQSTPIAARKAGGTAVAVHGTAPSHSIHTVAPLKTVALQNGGKATVRSNGSVRTIQVHEMKIDHGLHGDRHIVTEREGQRLVSTGPHEGYSQRTYLRRGGTTYVQRTYVVNHVVYTHVYRSCYYGGVAYYHYVPAYWYRPTFYGWAYNPWAAPVYYRWGWWEAPWYAPYGYYFAPYRVYPAASLWLTDYLLAETLKAAHQAEANASVAAQASARTSTPAPQAARSDNVVLTPEVKQAIADQVKAQIAAEQASAASGAQTTASQDQRPAALDPAQRVFVVATGIDVDAGGGKECTLTGGDVITRVTDTPDKNGNATVLVTASKNRDCAAGLLLPVAVQDLQEMHNRFREHLDTGLKELASNQGKGGIPAAPDTNTVNGEVPPAAPDIDAEHKLQAQQAEADQAEAGLRQHAIAAQSARN